MSGMSGFGSLRQLDRFLCSMKRSPWLLLLLRGTFWSLAVTWKRQQLIKGWKCYLKNAIPRIPQCLYWLGGHETCNPTSSFSTICHKQWLVYQGNEPISLPSGVAPSPKVFLGVPLAVSALVPHPTPPLQPVAWETGQTSLLIKVYRVFTFPRCSPLR